MNFYTQQHKHYCVIDLHARYTALSGTDKHERSLPLTAAPEGVEMYIPYTNNS